MTPAPVPPTSPEMTSVAAGLFRTVRPYELQWKHKGRLYRIIVPRWLVTDLASIPFFVRWLVSSTSLGFAAPLVHDWVIGQMRHGGFCQVEVFVSGEDSTPDMPFGWHELPATDCVWKRRDVDRLFFSIMRDRMKTWPTPSGVRGRVVKAWRRIVRRRAFNAVRFFAVGKKLMTGSEW